MSDITPQPTSVYRYYDQFGLLLYVGVTSRGAVRNAEHYSTKSWWPYVTRQEVQHLPSRPAALGRERALIHRYRPPFNTQHNPGSSELREAYLAMRSRGEAPGILGRNRMGLRVNQAGYFALLSSDCPPSALRVDGKFPVAGAKLVWIKAEGGHLTAAVQVKGQVARASLMYRHEPNGQYSVKRIDVEAAA